MEPRKSVGQPGAGGDAQTQGPQGAVRPARQSSASASREEGADVRSASSYRPESVPGPTRGGDEPSAAARSARERKKVWAGIPRFGSGQLFQHRASTSRSSASAASLFTVPSCS
jgi:hypothetical protein